MLEKLRIKQEEVSEEESLFSRWFNPNTPEKEREELRVKLAERARQAEVLAQQKVADEAIALENKDMQEAIPELEVPLKTIIKKIEDRIENGDYGLIIGDDASGRIPALVLGRFIQKISEYRSQRVPKIVFIPGKLWERESYEEYPEDGGRGEYYDVFTDEINARGIDLMALLDEYIKKYGADKNKRILIVTEVVESGDTLAYVHLLKKLGYTIDIATLSIFSDFVNAFEDSKVKANRRIENLKGAEIIDGEFKRGDNHFGSDVPKIYKKHKLSGVEKSFDEWGMPEFNSSKPIEKDSVDVQARINKAREDAKVVTQHLIDWYESQKENEK